MRSDMSAPSHRRIFPNEKVILCARRGCSSHPCKSPRRCSVLWSSFSFCVISTFRIAKPLPAPSFLQASYILHLSLQMYNTYILSTFPTSLGVQNTSKRRQAEDASGCPSSVSALSDPLLHQHSPKSRALNIGRCPLQKYRQSRPQAASDYPFS